MMMPNAAAGTVAMKLGIHGPGFSIASACATGSHAIGEAKRMIERGEADVVLAGGAEAALTGLCMAAFKRMGAMSREGMSRPFDLRRDGFVMGEGAAVLVLERAEHAARARRRRCTARIAGYGASNDAFHITQPAEDGRGAADAMRAALADAGASPVRRRLPQRARHRARRSTTASRRSAVHAVFNGGAPPVSSTKSNIGHLLGAAGAVEALACVEAVRRGVLPPTINLEQPDPECDLDHVAGAPREADDIELALSNSFGFGGQNACLAVTRGVSAVFDIVHDLPLARVRLELLFDPGTFRPIRSRRRRRRRCRQRPRQRPRRLRVGAGRRRTAAARSARPAARRSRARSRAPTRSAARSSASRTPAARGCRRARRRCRPTRRSSARRRPRPSRRSASSAARARAAPRTRRRSAT